MMNALDKLADAKEAAIKLEEQAKNTGNNSLGNDIKETNKDLQKITEEGEKLLKTLANIGTTAK